jgi:hypothetical protein
MTEEAFGTKICELQNFSANVKQARVFVHGEAFKPTQVEHPKRAPI